MSIQDKFVRRPPRKEAKHRINGFIRAQRVRLVSPALNGVVSLSEALAEASNAGLDLVEISPNADPPVCKVMDYSKFMYQQKQKDKDSAKNRPELKEVRFTPNIGDHDFDIKARQAIKFLKDGSKVKTQVQFKGRQMAHKEQGELVLLRLAEAVIEVGKPESLPKLEGKKMFMMLTPVKK